MNTYIKASIVDIKYIILFILFIEFLFIIDLSFFSILFLMSSMLSFSNSFFMYNGLPHFVDTSIYLFTLFMFIIYFLVIYIVPLIPCIT